MKLSEVKTSIVVALMKSVTTQDENKAINVSKDVERQVEIVGKFLGNKFLIECLTTAENCLNDPNRYVYGYALEALDRIDTSESNNCLKKYLKITRYCPYTTFESLF